MNVVDDSCDLSLSIQFFLSTRLALRNVEIALLFEGESSLIPSQLHTYTYASHGYNTWRLRETLWEDLSVSDVGWWSHGLLHSKLAPVG